MRYHIEYTTKTEHRKCSEERYSEELADALATAACDVLKAQSKRRDCITLDYASVTIWDEQEVKYILDLIF